MTRRRDRYEDSVKPPWLVGLGAVLLSFLLSGGAQAQGHNPWAAADQRAPPMGHQPLGDGRFVAPGYDPTAEERRRRAGESSRPAPRDMTWGQSWSGQGGLYAPPSLYSQDAGMGSQVPWTPGHYGIPGLSTYPGLMPYGGYPGGSILYPGTGLGLFSPLYGSPLGGLTPFGTPY